MATTFEIEVVNFDETTGRGTFIATGTDGERSVSARCTGQIDTKDVAASVKAKVWPTLANAYAENLAKAVAAEAASAIKTTVVDTLKGEFEKAQVV
ncbi:MAG TPA: hypothetical protein VMY35_06760 [Phycisphaerae bacterium]|nr:hypothetical protein [Phycisphaerae bacterium]